MIDPTLPLVDLHRHLDGNIRPELIWQLAQRHNIDLNVSDLAGVKSISQIHDKTSDLLAFLAKLDVGVSVLADVQSCYDVAYDNMLDAKRSALDYVELRFSPYYMAHKHDLPLAEVVEAVINGVRDGERDTGVKANLLGILSRTFGAEICMRELNSLLTHKQDIRGLDLAGDELGYPAELFKNHFKLARDAGWHITVHAGEADGPQSIWNAINMLGATRIGHGVAAVKDETLMDYLAKHEIAIESCPTSNYQTATVGDLAAHPMPVFYARGIKVTLNTDDPAVSGIDLENEYQVAHDVLGFSGEDLKVIQQNGLDAAFLSDTDKATIQQNIANR